MVALRRLLLFGGCIDCLLRLRGLGLDLALCPRKFAREGGTASTLLFELVSRRSGLLRKGGRFFAILLQLCRRLLRNLLELRCIIARLVQQRHFRLDSSRAVASSLERLSRSCCSSAVVISGV